MTIIHKAAYVIKLFDDYTKSSMVGGYHVESIPSSTRVLKKTKDTVIYADPIEMGTKFIINSDYYMQECITVNSSKDLIPYLEVYLKPSSKYPFKDGDTLIRFQAILNSSGKAAKEVLVQGHVLSKDEYIGRLREEWESGGGEIKEVEISLVSHDLLEQQYYTIVDGEKSALFKVITKTEIGYEIELVNGEAGCFSSGSLVCPGIFTVTDNKGYGFIYYSGIKSEKTNYRLLLSEGESSLELTGLFEDQKMINLGQLTL